MKGRAIRQEKKFHTQFATNLPSLTFFRGKNIVLKKNPNIVPYWKVVQSQWHSRASNLLFCVTINNELRNAALFSIFLLEHLQLTGKHKKTQVPRKRFSSLWVFWLEIWDGQFRQDNWPAVANFLPLLQLFDCQNDGSFLGKYAVLSKRFFDRRFTFGANIIAPEVIFDFERQQFRLGCQISSICVERNVLKYFFISEKTKLFSFLEEVFKLFWDKVWTLSEKIFSTV